MNGSVNTILNFRISQVKIKVYLSLVIACIVGYWPVSFNLFSLKNDATLYFLPYRYQISNSIQNGEFPFWSPYLYMGFPIHGDMQSGAWNPIVWVISLFTRYNMSVLHFESLLYIFLAGAGMYKLLGEFKINTRIRIAIAISYMFSGFVTDSGQFIVWLASATFIPFVFLYFHRLLYQPTYLNAFKTAIALCMLLWAGYPSLMIYCCYILLAGLCARLYNILTIKKKCLIRDLLSAQAAFVLLFLLISLPALLSYAELLPYYSRGTGIGLSSALMHPFSIKCATSFLIPFNLSRDDIGFGTDPTMRNTYTGLFSIVFLIPALSMKIDPVLKFVLAVFIITFLFTLGDATPIREISYRFVPLMNYFRHPASMRLFSSICILFIAAFGMDKLLKAGTENTGQKKLISSLSIAAVIAGLIIFYYAYAGWSFNIKPLFNHPGGLKQLLYGISFPFTILLVGIIQLVFLFLFVALRNSRKLSLYLPILIIVNALLIAQFSLPSTFVSAISPKKINQFINQFPAGYPVPELRSMVKEDSTQDSLYNPLAYGYENYYNKRIEIPRSITTPCLLTSTDSFLHSTVEKKLVSGHPVFYLSDTGRSEQSRLTVSEFHSNEFSLTTHTDKRSRLHVSQNYSRYWKATIDDLHVPIALSNISFMSISVPEGMHKVHFIYAPGNIYIAMIVSLLALILPLGYFLLIKLKK